MFQQWPAISWTSIFVPFSWACSGIHHILHNRHTDCHFSQIKCFPVRAASSSTTSFSHAFRSWTKRFHRRWSTFSTSWCCSPSSTWPSRLSASSILGLRIATFRHLETRWWSAQFSVSFCVHGVHSFLTYDNAFNPVFSRTLRLLAEVFSDSQALFILIFSFINFVVTAFRWWPKQLCQGALDRDRLSETTV